MLLLLSEYLMRYHSVFRVFSYLTLRAILGVLTALVFAFVCGPAMIRWLTAVKVGQRVRKDGPQSHLSKAGTPTMGGTLILAAIIIATLLWADLRNRYVWVLLGVTFFFGLIGFVDDYLKLRFKNSKGLKARTKYFWQSAFALAVALILYFTHHESAEIAYILPFFKQVSLPIGVLFVVVTYFVIVGTSNAVNLTDGLDGLAIMPTVLVGGALGVFAYASGNFKFAQYLAIPYLPGAGELAVFCGALAGAGLGFLWFNAYPGPGVHGRRGCAGARRRARQPGGDRAPGDRAADHGRRVRGGNHLGDPAGGSLQAHRQAHLPHGADAPPLRTEGLARATIIVRFWIITVMLVLVGLSTLKVR